MKFFSLSITIIFITLFGCKKSDSANVDLKGKVFYGVVVATCNPTQTSNLTQTDYVLMAFEDASGNDVSYQPKPNTWYKMSFGGGVWVKTGSDVTPKDVPMSFGFSTTEYSGPCK
jgi:hypothetical protein